MFYKKGQRMTTAEKMLFPLIMVYGIILAVGMVFFLAVAKIYKVILMGSRNVDATPLKRGTKFGRIQESKESH